MTILVLGGTGRVGSAAIDTLLAAGRNVRTISRSAERLALLPAGVEGVVADLDDPESLKPAFAGVEAVLVSLLVHPDEGVRGHNALQAAIEAGVGKVVHISVKHYPGSDDKLFYMAKQAIEKELLAAPVKHVIIRPANFHQSDSGMKAMIADQGIYPPPVGSVGIDRIDSRDVGYAAAQALITNAYDDQEVDLYGPERFTGETVAAVYARLLDRPVRYLGDDIDVWESFNEARLPQWYRTALRSLYIQQQAYGMGRPEGEPQHPLLPTELRTFEAYARELFAL
jgi:uncharacterized protein YbjT (DUF2867 family)